MSGERHNVFANAHHKIASALKNLDLTNHGSEGEDEALLL